MQVYIRSPHLATLGLLFLACSPALANNATCTNPCQNGGTCTAPNTCTCDVGWTGMQCERAIQCATPKARLENGKPSFSGVQYMSTANYTCDKGYILDGPSTITCMANGNWSGSAPHCKPIRCGEIPPDPANGQRSGSNTTFGSTVTYTCNKGYSLYSTPQGQVNKITLSCMADGNWNESVPQCKIVTCTSPTAAPANGTHRYSNTTFGSTITYTCNQGYKLIGYNRLTCMANGKWNGSAPRCSVIKCVAPLPGEPANGIRTLFGNTYGSTVNYSCNAGYNLIGPSVVTCMVNGEWSASGNVVQCVASCTKPCQNGGTCTAPDTCTCDVEWTGMQCETVFRVPSQVTGLSLFKAVKSGVPALRANWTAPQSDPTISKYLVHYRKTRTTVWGSELTIPGSPPLTSTILIRLDAATEYDVRVSAVSAAGNGMWSEVQTERTYGIPPHPNHHTVSAAPVDRRGVITVSWSAPIVSDGYLPIVGYSIKYKRQYSSTYKSVTTNVTEAMVTGLVPGSFYRVKVAVVTAAGTGQYCCEGTPLVVRTYNVTPQPSVNLTKSALQNLSISWSVTSPQDVTSYIVFWFMETAAIGKSDVFNDIMFTIENLLSNTAYHVVVQANGPLGSVNSTSKVFYTTPKKVQASLSVLVLPKQILKVSWKPANDAGRSPINYIINATMTDTEYNKSTSVEHSMTMTTLAGLPQYSAGTVSVWAKNPGAWSKPVILRVRMVNIVTNVTGVSAEWIDSRFSSLRVTVPEGGTYRISYSAVNKSNAKNSCTPLSRADISDYISHTAVIDELSSNCFYALLVDVVPSDFIESMSESVGVGIGIGVVVIVISILLLGLGCFCFARHRRNMNKKNFLPFKQQRTLGKSTLNEPAEVAMADVVNPIVDDQVDLQMAPDDGNADALANEPNTAFKHLFPAHVREMHRNRDEGFEREFGNVHDDPNASDSIAKQNRGRNRYLNTNTFDHSRVILKVPDENGCDYINASYIEGYGRSGHYIAAQGPRLEEVTIFWQMVMEHKPAVVVMLTNVEENGKRKCEKYWNDDLEKPYDAGRGFSAVTTGYRTFADYEVRDITVRNSTDRPHRVTHFQYTSWPDHGVPLHPSSLVKFAQEVKKVYSNSQAPMVVHCSAGVGRTGTFITLDAMMERLKERDDLNIFEFVTEMRTRRKQMVQTMDQYVFIHDALSDFITCGDTSVMAHQLRFVIDDMDKKDGAGKSGFEKQFEFIGSVCKMPIGEDGSFAKKSVVAKRNRYKDKYPYSTNYLHIAGRPPNNAADYINATMMASYSNKRGLVAAQSPLESTRTDVWELIWQFRTKTVVLLGPLKEGKKIMCSPFWPNESVHSIEYGQLLVTFVNTTPKPDWEMTALQVADKNRSSESFHEVTLFHFISWPREGRPPIDSLLKMMGEVENKQKESKAPLMVMCDDGMSRTGVFITCMSEIERVKVEGGVDIFQTVKTARAQRPHMVYTSDQYKLCFEILQCHLDSFDTYANFKAV